MLLKAYQSMRADDFELFVGFFMAEKRDMNATGRDGRSVLDIVKTHGMAWSTPRSWWLPVRFSFSY